MHKHIDLANLINILPENPRILDKKRIIQHHSKEIGTNGAPPDNFEQFFPIKKTHPFYIIWQSMKCSEIEGTIMMASTKKKTRKRKQKTKKRKRKKKNDEIHQIHGLEGKRKIDEFGFATVCGGIY